MALDHPDHPHDVAHGPRAWLVVNRSEPVGSLAAVFWNRADALSYVAELPVSAESILIRQVSVRGERYRCRLCGEPVRLDDPVDRDSWVHAEDANDLGDHTAEL